MYRRKVGARYSQDNNADSVSALKVSHVTPGSRFSLNFFNTVTITSSPIVTPTAVSS